MKTTYTVAAAVAALVGVGAAQAASIVPSTGDGSLMFFLTDTKTNTTYTDVLTQNVNSYFSSAQATTPAPTAGVINTITGDASFQINLSTDPNLTSFLTTAGSDPLSWGVIAGAYTGALGATQRPIGHVRYIATTGNQASVLAVPQTSIVNAMANGLNLDVGTLNTNLGTASSTTSGVFGTSTSSGGTALTYYGGGIAMDSVLVGQSVGLYGVTGNGTASGTGFAFSLGTMTYGAVAGVGADVLTFTGNAGSAVPLPAAVWLLGSGLLGLAGVSRRRLAVAS
jgi:hypothetical protein